MQYSADYWNRYYDPKVGRFVKMALSVKEPGSIKSDRDSLGCITAVNATVKFCTKHFHKDLADAVARRIPKS